MRRLSGSGLDHADTCPAAFALPCVDTPPGEEAEYGTAVHKYLETDEPTPGYEEHCAAIDLDFVRPIGDGPDYREVTFAYWPNSSTNSGRVKLVGRSLDRNYADIPDGAIPITLDRVYYLDGYWRVDDYKTGREAPSVDSLQLGLGAVCVSRQFGAGDVIVSIVHIPKDGRPDRIEKELSLFDLDCIEDRICKIDKAVTAVRDTLANGRPLDVKTSGYCRYCPAMAACPAYAGLVRKALGLAEMVEAVEVLPIETIAEAWPEVERAATLVEAVRGAMKARIAQHGKVQLADGSALTPITSERRTINLEKAAPVFDKHGIVPKLTQSVNLTAVKVATEAAVAEEAAELDKKKASQLLKAKQASVLRDLHEAGAILYKDVTTVRHTKQ